MSIEISKESKASNVKEVADKIINHNWNRRSSGKVSYILNGLGSDLSDIRTFIETLKTERERMKNGTVLTRDDFGHYYGKTLIEDMEELLVIIEKNRTNKTFFSTEEIAGHALLNAIKDNFNFRDVNWKNYEFLRKESLVRFFSEYDTYFRGNITQVHRIKNDEYIIIQTEKHPYDYDKQRTKWDEPAEDNFYILKKNDKGNIYHDSTMFSNFEDALFAVVCPQYSSAMSALLNQSKIG